MPHSNETILMCDEFKRSGAGTMEQLARRWYDECPLVFRVEINAAGVSDGFKIDFINGSRR